MNLRKALLLPALLIILHTAIAGSKPGMVTISGTIININNKMQVADISELKELQLPNDARTFIPDSAGRFKVSFKLDAPNYFKIGRNVLYLSPGDDLTVALDYKYPEKGVINGPGAAANNYLRYTPYPHAGSFIDGGRNIKATLQRTIDTVLNIARVREKELNTVKADPVFLSYEHARIKADVLNSLREIFSYYPLMHKLPKDSLMAFREQWLKAIAPYKAEYSKGMINPDYLRLEVYAGIAFSILDKDDHSPAAEKIRDWITASDLTYDIQHTADKQVILAAKPKIDAIVNPVYRAAATATYNDLIRFGNGDKAIDVAFVTADNKKLHLSDYAGKVVFVDIWATWCGPCLQELPYLEKLKEKYKDNPNMVFISLSIDDDRAAWKKSWKA